MKAVIERNVRRPTASGRWHDLLIRMKKDDSFFIPNKGKSQLYYVRVVAEKVGVAVTLANDVTDGVRGVRVFCDGPAKTEGVCKRKKTKK